MSHQGTFMDELMQEIHPFVLGLMSMLSLLEPYVNLSSVQLVCVFSKWSRPALGRTHPAFQWEPGALSPSGT
jgi:hypothetical protein